MKNCHTLLWSLFLTVMLTISPAQAGEAKRKTLSAIRKILKPLRIVTGLVFLGTTLADERLERDIQRDRDKEFNKAAVESSQQEVQK